MSSKMRAPLLILSLKGSSFDHGVILLVGDGENSSVLDPFIEKRIRKASLVNTVERVRSPSIEGPHGCYAHPPAGA